MAWFNMKCGCHIELNSYLKLVAIDKFCSNHSDRIDSMIATWNLPDNFLTIKNIYDMDLDNEKVTFPTKFESKSRQV